MKMNKLFTFTLAALTFAACSNDETLENENPNGGDLTGQIVETMTVSFVNSNSTTSRAGEGEIDGVDTENHVYKAYIFARENAPKHQGAMAGDWTVKEVTGTPNPANTHTFGLDKIDEGSATTEKSLKFMASFEQVALGDSVYVIANDPNMTLETANNLAHKAGKSQSSIRSYISKLRKDYLQGLSYGKKGLAPSTKPQGAYIMGGASMIPLSPAVPNNTNVAVEVALDREMAKVFFGASVSTDEGAAAKGRAAFKATDGVMVVRIPREVSYFAPQEAKFYFPTDKLAANNDWSNTWLGAFDGMKESAPGVTATPTAPFFNSTPFAVADAATTAKEYRYTWVAGTNGTEGSMMDGERMVTPFFYVTPNYANNAFTTCVVAQATYVGINTLLDDNKKMLPLASMLPTIYNKLAAANTGVFEKSGTTIPLKEVEWTPTQLAALKTYGTTPGNKTDIEAGLVAASLTAADYDAFVAALTALPDASDDATAAKYLDYQKDITKMYYRADIAEYDAKGEVSMKITERNTFYQMSAEITSLGAKTIDDAINSDVIGMIVKVKVNPWKLKITNIKL